MGEGEGTKARCQVRKGVFQGGEVRLEEHGVVWEPEEAGELGRVEMPYGTITAHQRGTKSASLRLVGGKEPGARVFQFDSQEERDKVSESLASKLGGKGSGDKGNGEAARKALLASDPELHEVHQELVQGGVISEEEFWRARQHLLDEASGRVSSTPHRKSRQKQGISSAMMSDLPARGNAVMGEQMTVPVSMSTAEIQNILAERPDVRRAYLANVPAKMSEKAFWQSFWEAEQTKRVRGSTGAVTQREQELLELFKEDPSLQRQSDRAKCLRVDPSLDLSADRGDSLLEGYGTARAGHKDSLSSSSLFSSVNHHGEAALEGPPGDSSDIHSAAIAAERRDERWRHVRQEDEERLDRARYAQLAEEERDTLPDLRAGSEADVATIEVPDPKRYFAGSAGASRGGECGEEEARKVAAELREKRAVTERVSSREALEALEELGRAASGNEGQPDWVEGRSPVGLGEPEERELRRGERVAGELMRVFWGGVPAVTKPRMERLERVMGAAQSLYERLRAWKEGLPPERRHPASVAVRPLLQSLDAAFERLDAERDAWTRYRRHQEGNPPD